MISPEHRFYIRPDLRKAASTKAESTTAESVIRPKQLARTTFQQRLHMEVISRIWSDTPACGSFHDFIDKGLLLTSKVLNQGLSWSLHFESFTVTAMTLLAFMDHPPCQKWPWICLTCRNTFLSVPHSLPIADFTAGLFYSIFSFICDVL